MSNLTSPLLHKSHSAQPLSYNGEGKTIATSSRVQTEDVPLITDSSELTNSTTNVDGLTSQELVYEKHTLKKKLNLY
jgi:hypothetical protein